MNNFILQVVNNKFTKHTGTGSPRNRIRIKRIISCAEESCYLVNMESSLQQHNGLKTYNKSDSSLYAPLHYVDNTEEQALSIEFNCIDRIRLPQYGIY